MKYSDMRKNKSIDEGKYKSNAQRKAVHAAKAEKVTEAGGHYTQPVYDMIEQHGYEKVMHELLTSLDADVIQDFISRADLEEGKSPHKKGTAKYKKHMAAMHAETTAGAIGSSMGGGNGFANGGPGTMARPMIRKKKK